MDRPFLAAGTISLCTSLVFYLLLTTMAVYAAERFHADDAIAGFCATSFILGAVASRLLADTLMRLAGRRAVILFGTCASVAIVALTPIAQDVWQLIGIRLAHGFAFGAVSTLVVSGVLTRVPARRRAEAAGYLGLPSTVATAVGPFLAVTLLNRGGHGVLFGACVAISAAAAVASLLLVLPDGRESRRRRNSAISHPGNLPRRVDRRLVSLAVVILLVGFAYSGVIAYLVAYAATIGAEWSVGIYFASYAVIALIGRLLIGRIQDRLGDNVIVFPVLASFALSLALLALASNGIMIALAGIFMGFGFGLFLPTMQAAASHLVPNARMNVSVATVYVSMDLGVGVAPILLGLVIFDIGYAGMYLALAGLIILAGSLYAAGHGRTTGGRPASLSP